MRFSRGVKKCQLLSLIQNWRQNRFSNENIWNLESSNEKGLPRGQSFKDLLTELKEAL